MEKNCEETGEIGTVARNCSFDEVCGEPEGNTEERKQKQLLSAEILKNFEIFENCKSNLHNWQF